MRRVWIALAAAGLPWVSVAAATPDQFKIRSTDDLVAVCTTREGDSLYGPSIGFCHGFVVRAIQYHSALYDRGKHKPIYCLPDPPPTRSEGLRNFVAWVQANPKYGSEPAVESVFKYLVEKYPCAAK